MNQPLLELDKILQRKITESSRHSYGNKWRSAAVFVLKFAQAGLYSSDTDLLAHCELCKQKLQSLIQDEEWLKIWNKGVPIERSLLAELAAVEELERVTRRRGKKGQSRHGAGIIGRVVEIEKTLKKRKILKGKKKR